MKDNYIESFNTASGKYCCNSRYFHRLGRGFGLSVSIPQAVSTVATLKLIFHSSSFLFRFNTASGKYCCNKDSWKVVITNNCFNTASGKYCCNYQKLKLRTTVLVSLTSFNTASGKYCCNYRLSGLSPEQLVGFNTASGKYCCNAMERYLIFLSTEFQYRKR